MALFELNLERDRVLLKGNIDFSNVVEVYREGVQYITPLDKIYIDLKGLLQSNSSALALMTSWVRFAREKNKKIFFLNMPPYLENIAKVYGLKGDLPTLWES